MTRSIAALVICVAAGSAHAGVFMSTATFGPNTPNFLEVLTLDKYNGNIADLVSIKIKVQIDIDGGNLQLDNDGDEPAQGNAMLGAQAAISSVDVPLLDAAFQPVVGPAAAFTATAFAIAGDDGDGPMFQAGGDDSFLFNGGPASDMQMGFINPLFFADFSGGGTFSVEVNATQIFEYGALGGVEFAGGPVSASGSVMVIYDFIPTPGAATIVGLAGLVGLRRRR